MFLDLTRARTKRGLCNCWDCLRESGLTPPRSLAANFPTLRGQVMQTSDGMPDHSIKKVEDVTESEAAYVMEKGRGQND